MTYQVVVQPSAQAELDEACRWVHQQSPARAVKWYHGLLEALRSLESNPERCGLAPESEYFEEQIRQLLYGKRNGVYRILFTVQGQTVSVLHIRHGARRLLDPGEL